MVEVAGNQRQEEKNRTTMKRLDKMTYKPLSIEESIDQDEESLGGDSTATASFRKTQAKKTLWNFTLMSILFSANHGCVVGKYRARAC